VTNFDTASLKDMVDGEYPLCSQLAHTFYHFKSCTSPSAVSYAAAWIRIRFRLVASVVKLTTMMRCRQCSSFPSPHVLQPGCQSYPTRVPYSIDNLNPTP
jgi:hypothetical protein